MRKFYFVCLFSLATSVVSAQNFNLKINEIVASNRTGQMDDFFDRDDWIEIYNPAGNPITNLAGYYLSDDPLDLTKWQIPSSNAGVTTILPNSFKAIWIDNDPEQGEDHVGGFTLSVDGEAIILTAPDGNSIIDMVEFPELAPDISYGRVCDGCDEWMFFNNVTFESTNFEFQPNHSLLVNEVQTINLTIIHDRENEYEPWFEIFNPNAFQVNLANYYISIGDNPLQWRVAADNPGKTVIPPNGFKLIWCDEDVLDGTTHAPFTLPVNGGTITLTSPDGTIQYDTYVYGVIDADKSRGRQTDGSGTSITFNAPTPTMTNTLTFIQPQPLFINEVLAANQSGITDEADQLEDWFEIYNPNNFDVNLAGYYISDNPEIRNKWRVPVDFPDSVTVPANGWLLFWADDDTQQGVLHTNFRLRNNVEYLGLFSPDGFTIADDISWDYIFPDQSLGRFTDGGSVWVQFSETTPEESNNGAIVYVQQIDALTLDVFPNPTSDRLIFSKVADINVYSINGALISSHNRVSILDVKDWANGIYLLKTTEGEVIRVVKY